MIRRAGWLIAVTAIGCSFSGPPGFDDSSDNDGDNDEVTGDAAPDAPPMLGPFQTPRRLAEIEAALFGDEVGDEYDDPSISDSGELLFAATSGEGETMSADVFRAQLDPTSMMFIDVAVVPELSTQGFETTPFIAANGLTALVSTGGDLFVSSRVAIGAAWGTLEPIAESQNNLINSNAIEAFGQLSPDHQRLYFSSNRDGDFDLFVATRDGDGEYGSVTRIPVSQAGRDETSPRLSDDELTLYYTADSGGTTADLYSARRRAIEEPFAGEALVAELSSGARDADLAVSGDHRIAVFSSDRETPGSFRLYISQR